MTQPPYRGIYRINFVPTFYRKYVKVGQRFAGLYRRQKKRFLVHSNLGSHTGLWQSAVCHGVCIMYECLLTPTGGPVMDLSAQL